MYRLLVLRVQLNLVCIQIGGFWFQMVLGFGRQGLREFQNFVPFKRFLLLQGFRIEEARFFSC